MYYFNRFRVTTIIETKKSEVNMNDLLTSEINKCTNIKGELLLCKDNISLIQINAEKEIGCIWYQVWNHYENFIFIRTKSLKEAMNTYVKYNCN